MSELPFRKLANALFPNAVPSSLMPDGASAAVERQRRKSGGMWVGGSIEVTSEFLSFTPNAMNVSFHEPLETVRIALGDIRSVRREFGWVTGIVVVEHPPGEFRFRCFAARKVADLIRASANKAKNR